MSKWELVPFNEIIIDETKKGKKIKKEDYLEFGKYPIIDQGMNDIAGYTNEEEGIFTNVPVIIFGDHTRVIKYIDTPFFLGADGVKVLKATQDDINYKYLYYFFRKNEVPNTGYNRHFKWLKELNIPIPPLEIQNKIAKTLDTASELISLRKKQLEELDNLIKSIFYDMFGDPLTNEKGWQKKFWNDIFNTTTGKLDSNAACKNGKYPFFTCSKDMLRINEYAFDCEALLLAGNNASAIYDVKYYNGKFNAYQRTYVITLKSERDQYLFYKFLLEQKLTEMKQNSKGTNTKYLTLEILRRLDFIVPPQQLQTKFAEIVTKIEEKKALVQKAINESQYLFDSLMSKYFD